MLKLEHYTEDEELNWYWLGATFISEILDNYVQLKIAGKEIQSP